MPPRTGTCEYILDPKEPETWGGSAGEQCHIDPAALNEDGLWTCPHDAAHEEDLCLFHLPVEKKEDRAVIEAFVQALETAADAPDSQTRERVLQFIGARFGTFDLRDYSVDGLPTAAGIDLSYASVADSLDWRDATLDIEFLLFIGTRFGGNVSFEGVAFGEYTAFLAAEFAGDANFEAAVFGGEGDFRSASFSGDTSFSSARFGDRADFSSVEVSGDGDFSTVTIDGDGVFSRTTFRGDFSLTATEIRGDAHFMGMKVVKAASFDSLVVEGDTNLQFAEFDGVDSSGML